MDTPAASHRPAHSESRYVEAGGLRFHYLDYGTAGRPAMLCVHGGAAQGHWFDYVARDFSRDYHVLALDQRGHGDSAWVSPPAYSYNDYAADLAAIADKLDLRDFVLVGHSMGGMVSLVYAATHPGRVERLVIVDSSMQLSEERIANMRNIGNRQGSRYATREELVQRYRLRPGNTFAPPEVVRHVAAHSARQQADGTWGYKFDRNVYAIRERMDGMPYWARIDVPALVVKGDHSGRITPEIHAGIKALCPHVELAEVARSDHHVTLDNPAGFIEAVRAFLARHQGVVG